MSRIFNLINLIIFSSVFLFSPFLTKAEELSSRLKGKILLQVESNGEAWYVNPENEKRYYLGRPADAFNVMRELGLGISNKDFDSFNGFASKRLAGKILLKVEDKGQAYYVSPDDLKMHYLGRPDDAFRIMRELGLGISNVNLSKIKAFSFEVQDVQNVKVGTFKILGKIIDSNKKPINKNIIYWLSKDGNEDEVIAFYESSDSNFLIENLDKGSYKLEAWLEEDLKNKGKFEGIAPIYSTIVSIKGDENLTLNAQRNTEIQEVLKINEKSNWCNGKLYQPCPAGFDFFCVNGLTGTCKKVAKEISINTTQLEKQIYAMINYNRAKNDLSPLKWNSTLAKSAKAHSKDMAENNYFSIEKTDCSIMCRYNENKNLHSRFSENIFSLSKAKNIYDDGSIAEYNSQYEIAKMTTDGWMNSVDSLESLLTNKHEYQGLGVEISNQGKVYVSQDISNFLTQEEIVELKDIVNLITGGLSTKREKVEAVHAWITQNIAYNVKGYIEGEVEYLNYSSVGAFRNKMAVCQGYAELARLMLLFASIDSEVVVGRSYVVSSYEDHAWNKVEIDGEELYFDSTWDSGYIDGDEFKRDPKKIYFLIPKECIRVDHVLDGEEQFDRVLQKGYIENRLDLFNNKCLLLKNKIIN